jgi:hypothetical protein
MSRADLLRLKERKFEVASAEERNDLAPRLLGCLADPDPTIRDGVVFEGLSTWMRGKALSKPTLASVMASLVATLEGPGDAAGFRLPFAALVLSEVARTDRIEAWLSDGERARMVELASSSLERVDDYRGFDPREGWRHGVAHGSDLILQLALNPKVGADQLRRMALALAAQVAPRRSVFYEFSEPERLARAFTYAYRRGVVDAAFWSEWFKTLSTPAPLANWDEAFASVEGMARRHNTLAFVHAVSFAGRQAKDETGLALARLADEAAAQVLGG